ncbi:MAG: MaoC family dehydratase N-terminal domain-containing protein [Dehalococcoidia bacterium]|nr:MaoC family dehydratase N-terminal domain-containing protein [Dehalococcoidia bacterium]
MAEDFKFPVDLSAIMLFARSLGDIRPEYSDPDSPEAKAVGGVVTPPTFVQSSSHWQPDYPLDLTRPRTGPPPKHRGDEGGGGLGRGLHAEQHYEYHHPIYAGDTLTVSTRPGERWEKEGRRGGKLQFSESITEYRNQDGVLCVTARSVGVQTERTVDQ